MSLSLCLCGHPHAPHAVGCLQCPCTRFRPAGRGFEGTGPAPPPEPMTTALVGPFGCHECGSCPGHRHHAQCGLVDVILSEEQACEYERGVGVSLLGLPGRVGQALVATVKAFAYDSQTPADAAQSVAAQAPVVSFVGAFDRRDWERLKRAVDRAFDAYEAKWPTP